MGKFSETRDIKVPNHLARAKPFSWLSEGIDLFQCSATNKWP